MIATWLLTRVVVSLVVVSLPLVVSVSTIEVIAWAELWV
jgi:hypothetical protein